MVDTTFTTKSSPFGTEEKLAMQKKLPLSMGLYCVRATFASCNTKAAESPRKDGSD